MKINWIVGDTWKACTTLISCYSLTNPSDQTDTITFYNELSSLVRSILKHSELIIEGDMNALIDIEDTNTFCLHNSVIQKITTFKKRGISNRYLTRKPTDMS